MTIYRVSVPEVCDNDVHTRVSDAGVFGVRVLTMMDCAKARAIASDPKNEIAYNGRIHGIYSAVPAPGSTGIFYTFEIQDRRSIVGEMENLID